MSVVVYPQLGSHTLKCHTTNRRLLFASLHTSLKSSLNSGPFVVADCRDGLPICCFWWRVFFVTTYTVTCSALVFCMASCLKAVAIFSTKGGRFAPSVTLKDPVPCRVGVLPVSLKAMTIGGVICAFMYTSGSVCHQAVTEARGGFSGDIRLPYGSIIYNNFRLARDL